MEIEKIVPKDGPSIEEVKKYIDKYNKISSTLIRECLNKGNFDLLKKNVSIISDNFELKADFVKAYFDKDLYDISKIESEKDVTIESLESKIDKIAKGLEFFSSRLSDLEKEKN